MSIKERITRRFRRRSPEEEEEERKRLLMEAERKAEEKRRKELLKQQEKEKEEEEKEEDDTDVKTIKSEQRAYKPSRRERVERATGRAADKIEGGVKAVDRFHKKADRATNRAMLAKEEAESRIRKEQKRTGDSSSLNVNWDFVLGKKPTPPKLSKKPGIQKDPLLTFYGSGGKSETAKQKDDPVMKMFSIGSGSTTKKGQPKDDPLMRMYGAGRPAQAKKKGPDPLMAMYNIGGDKSEKKKKNDPLLGLYSMKSNGSMKTLARKDDPLMRMIGSKLDNKNPAVLFSMKDRKKGLGLF